MDGLERYGRRERERERAKESGRERDRVAWTDEAEMDEWMKKKD